MPYAGEVKKSILRKKASKGTFTFSSFQWAVLLPPRLEVLENTGLYATRANPGTQMGEMLETWRWEPYIMRPEGTLEGGLAGGTGHAYAAAHATCSHLLMHTVRIRAEGRFVRGVGVC